MATPWTTTSVADCLTPVPAAGKTKLQARDYKPAGRYPVVDQGQERIAGWTDDESAVIKEPLPLIVFGDHTRAFKFINEPFARGADGTQLLKPKPGIDPLFFFYACRAIDLPARGYNRHFTMLKEQDVSYPGEAEQQAVGSVLRRVDFALEQQSGLIGNAQALKQAAMQKLFTRGLLGKQQKATTLGQAPDDWIESNIARLGEVVTGTTPPTRESAYYVAGDIPFISPGDIEHGACIERTQKVITQAGLAVSRGLPAGSTCVVCIGSTIGKVGRTTAPASATNQQINAIIPGSEFDPSYVSHLMTYWSSQVRNASSPSPVPILSKGAFEKVLVVMSLDLDEQRGIAAILEAIDRKIDLHRRKRAVLDDLFKALLHNLMTGQIAVDQLDLSALPATPVPEGASA